MENRNSRRILFYKNFVLQDQELCFTKFFWLVPGCYQKLENKIVMKSGCSRWLSQVGPVGTRLFSKIGIQDSNGRWVFQIVFQSLDGTRLLSKIGIIEEQRYCQRWMY